MTGHIINKTAKMLALREGGKSQARIADIRQLLKLLVKDHAENYNVGRDGGLADTYLGSLVLYGDELARKKKIKK